MDILMILETFITILVMFIMFILLHSGLPFLLIICSTGDFRRFDIIPKMLCCMICCFNSRN